MTGIFQFTVRLLAETEARFTSVQRIHHYIKVRMLTAAENNLTFLVKYFR